MKNSVLGNPEVSIQTIEILKKDPNISKNFNILTKYIIAKCLSNNITNEKDLKSYIRQIQKTKCYKFFKTPNSVNSERIFKERNEEYVRFCKKTEDIDYSTLISVHGFNIKEGSRDLFYVKRDVNKKLIKSIKNGDNILLTGPMKVGKTRLVFDEVRKLKGYYIFCLSQEAFHQIDKLIISEEFNRDNRKLIWFIDDIHYFSGNKNMFFDPVYRIYEKLISKFGKIVLIATLRSTENFDSEIYKHFNILNVTNWTKDEAEKIATRYNLDISKFTGTPFSLIKDFNETKEFYKKIIQKDINLLNLIKSIKLLYTITPLFKVNTTEAVFLKLAARSSKEDFYINIKKLEKIGFLTIEDEIISTWKPYIEEIISIKEYYDFENDIDKLLDVFFNKKKIIGLYYLAKYYSSKKKHIKAIECYKKIIKLKNFALNTDDSKHFVASSYFYWGAELLLLINNKIDKKRLYPKIINMIQTAVSIDNNLYYLRGYAIINYYAAINNIDKKRINIALKYINLCIKLSGKEKEHNCEFREWRTEILAAKAKYDNDYNLMLDALKEINALIKIGAMKHSAHYIKGSILLNIAEYKKDYNILNSATKSFKRSHKFKEKELDISSIFLRIAMLLTKLNEINLGIIAYYDKLFDAFEKNITREGEYNNGDLASFYYGWGLLRYYGYNRTSRKNDRYSNSTHFLVSSAYFISDYDYNRAYSVCKVALSSCVRELNAYIYIFAVSFYCALKIILKKGEIEKECFDTLETLRIDRPNDILLGPLIDGIFKNDNILPVVDTENGKDPLLNASAVLTKELIKKNKTSYQTKSGA